ncbi:hypothetical protein ACFQ1E_02380 [Sphingomonas canadensis]|uniref:Uncharacterized protein n=1 Tax=Sphingomonas canadensis TaxID=1219257 RepID=A0ABW3H170_9SPHN|nr:hypothetical protein [Sphingomonas canadensis]MCW3834912.1 hypothetical protein [Sphingomonas canadensis]
MRYFVDAEYNGFCGPMISLALVPEAPGLAPFYESTGCADPTPWVSEHVLPVLHTTPVERFELGRRLAEYLASDPDPLLIADWPEDIAHAAMALVAGPGRRHDVSHVRFELCDAFGFDAAALSTVPHNALHDAVALRDFMLHREAREPR